MNKNAVISFMRRLGCKDIREGDIWINAKCPLAPYTHTHAVDRRPSFGISVSKAGRSVYHCFSCAADSRSLIHLIHRLHMLTGEYPEKLSIMLIANENWTEEVQNVEIKDVWQEQPEALPLFPMELLELFPLLSGNTCEEAIKVKTYLLQRGIYPATISQFDLRFDKDPLSVIFPFTNVKGEICVLRRRGIRSKYIETISIEGFPTLKSTGAWFGLHLPTNETPLILVEGEIDALRLWSLGFESIASGGTSVTKSQAQALLAPNIIIGFDADEAGIQGRNRFVRYVGKGLIISFVDWSLIGLKDPTDRPEGRELAGRDQIETVIEKARLFNV